MGKKEKKPRSVEDIVAEYRKFHHAAGKEFKDRIKKFEEFHSPDNIDRQIISEHAHYTVFGKPGDNNYPGAYNEMYKTLDKLVADDNARIDDEEMLMKILESYADTFLQQAMGKKFNEALKEAEARGIKGRDLRQLKGQLLSQYIRDQRGQPLNILHEDFVRQYKGKKKIELKEQFRGLGEQMKQRYAAHLSREALEGLVIEEDRIDMARYITPIFEKRGITHPDPHITRSAAEQASHYGALLQGAHESLQKEAGYKIKKVEHKEEKS